jgi:hypothetical protein
MARQASLGLLRKAGLGATGRGKAGMDKLIFNPIQYFILNNCPPDPKLPTYWCADCGEFSDDRTPARVDCWDGDSCPLCGGINCEFVGYTWGPR